MSDELIIPVNSNVSNVDPFIAKETAYRINQELNVRAAKRELQGAFCSILLALIIGVGYGVFKFTMCFFVYDETAAAVSGVSTVAAHDFFVQRSFTGMINGTLCVIWNWIRIYPMRFTVVVMALIALRNHHRARKYKRMWEQIVDL